MISKGNRRNTNFQIVHFLVGSCHTPDGAYALLCSQRDERQMAINAYQVEILRRDAKRLSIQRRLTSDDPYERKMAEADVLEVEQATVVGERLHAAAVEELDFILAAMEALRPLCKFADLDDAAATEAMQSEEWKRELIRRAENYTLCGLPIPPDQFEAMREHPAFVSDILPALAKLKTVEGLKQLEKCISTPKFPQVVALLESQK